MCVHVCVIVYVCGYVCIRFDNENVNDDHPLNYI